MTSGQLALFHTLSSCWFCLVSCFLFQGLFSINGRSLEGPCGRMVVQMALRKRQTRGPKKKDKQKHVQEGLTKRNEEEQKGTKKIHTPF